MLVVVTKKVLHTQKDRVIPQVLVDLELKSMVIAQMKSFLKITQSFRIGMLLSRHNNQDSSLLNSITMDKNKN